jgi:hypothetical protein
VNPNPGWCWDGHLAKMSAIMSLSYSEMLMFILQEAEQRLGIQTELREFEQNGHVFPDNKQRVEREVMGL